ncbi:MAG TPA: hypothetical protein VN041_13125 [Microbacterium sp.]|nr:hypothetical protein [Microbacterium sp.]
MSTDDRPVPVWPRMGLRASSCIAAGLLALQSLTAGLFLAGVEAAFDVHRETATAAGIAIMVGIVFGVMSVRLRGESWKPVMWSVGLLALMSLQAFAGFRSLTALHVPLGVLTIFAGVMVTAVSWGSPFGRAEGRTSADGSGGRRSRRNK